MDHQTKQSISNLKAFVALGFFLAFLGGFVLAAAWPTTEINAITGEIEETGGGLGVTIGFFVAWVGNVMLFVGLVGWGVKMGREASPANPQV